MGEQLITTSDDKRPRIICPHCREHILIDLEAFKKDISQIMRDNCVKCRGEIFVGVLIMANSNLPALASEIQTVIDVLKPRQRIIG
jgi:hypothetical protein